MNPAPLRLGLVGAGAWGRNYVGAISRVAGVGLARVASRNPASADLVEETGALHADWRDMLAVGDLDGVVIASPPASHAEIALAALERGCAILVEKPLTLDLAAARTLRDRARALGAVAQVDHIDLANPAWRALKARLPEIGAPRRLRGAWANKGPVRSDVSGLWDYGPHAIAVCLDLLGGEPDTVAARYLARVGAAVLIEVRLAWGEEISAELQIGNAAQAKARNLTVEGTKGRMRYDDLADERALLDDAPVPYRAQTPLEAVVERFVAAIREGGPECADLDLGVRVVATLGRIEAALGEGAA